MLLPVEPHSFCNRKSVHGVLLSSVCTRAGGGDGGHVHHRRPVQARHARTPLAGVRPPNESSGPCPCAWSCRLVSLSSLQQEHTCRATWYRAYWLGQEFMHHDIHGVGCHSSGGGKLGEQSGGRCLSAVPPCKYWGLPRCRSPQQQVPCRGNRCVTGKKRVL